MRTLIRAACVAWLCSVVPAGAQQAAGPGEVVRPRATEPPEGVKLVGCVLAETSPNRFRLVVGTPEAKSGPAAKLPKGLTPGSAVDLIARGETNLQPYANQKVELTGTLSTTGRRQRFEVTDVRPMGVCEPAARPSQ